MFATVSTPTCLDLPDGVERTTIHTGRGSFAALEAVPVPGACERDVALLIPGYTGSKEDFLAILGQLAAGGRRVIAIDMRGQYETPGTDDLDGYAVSARRLRHSGRHPRDRRAARARSFIRRPDRPGGCTGQRWTGQRRTRRHCTRQRWAGGPGRRRLAYADELGPGRSGRAAGGGTARHAGRPRRRERRPAGQGPAAGRGRRDLAGLPGTAGRGGGSHRAGACVPGQADEEQRPRARWCSRPGTCSPPRTGRWTWRGLARSRCSSCTGRTTTPGRRPPRRTWPGACGLAGCASPVPRTPPRSRRRRRPRAR